MGSKKCRGGMSTETSPKPWLVLSLCEDTCSGSTHNTISKPEMLQKAILNPEDYDKRKTQGMEQLVLSWPKQIFIDASCSGWRLGFRATGLKI